MSERPKKLSPKESPQTEEVTEVMQAFGFRQCRGQRHRHWEFSGRSKADYPWQQLRWETVVRRGKIYTDQLTMVFSQELFVSRIKKAAKTIYGSRTQAEVKGENLTEQWCLFEFVGPGNRERMRQWQATVEDPIPPVGVAGFKLSLVVEQASIGYGLSEFFAVGFVPESFATGTRSLIEEALGFNRVRNLVAAGDFSNLFEGKVDLLKLALASGYKGKVRKKGVDPKLKVLAHAIEEEGRQHSNLKSQDGVLRLSLHDPLGSIALIDDTMVTKLPVEVLESREEGSQLRQIDRDLTGRKFERFELAVKQYQDHNLPLHLVRRMCLVGVTNKRMSESLEIKRWSNRFDRDMLFLSYDIQRSMARLDRGKVLEVLSRLTVLLMEKIQGIDEVGIFDVILPELLGDAWLSQDHERAIACYSRVLQSRGPVPRILRKIIAVAKQTDNAALEFEYLKELSGVEKRKKDLSGIYFRLAQLADQLQDIWPNLQPLEFTTKAYSYDGSNPSLVDLLSDQMLARKMPEQAIALLDDFLSKYRHSVADKWILEFETKVAQVWEEQLQRPDLALGRYQEAFRRDQSYLPAINFLESYYRSQSNAAGLAEILVAKMMLPSTGAEAKYDDLDEIRRLQRQHRDQDNSAEFLKAGLYQLTCSRLLRETDVDLLLTFEFTEPQWREIYQSVKDTFAETPDLGKRGKTFLILSHIARDKMNSIKLSLGHLLDALKIDRIDQVNFDYLVKILRSFGDKRLLSKVYDLRIAQVDEEQRVVLMEQLLRTPDLLTDARKEEISLGLMATKNDPSEVVGRLRSYIDSNDTEGINRLKNGVFEVCGTKEKRRQWLKKIIDLCADRGSIKFVSLQDQFFQELLELSEDTGKVLVEAVRLFHNIDAWEVMRRYVKLTMAHGVLPPVPKSVVEGQFGWESPEHLDYLMLQIKQADRKSLQLKIVEDALQIVVRIDPFDSRRLELLFVAGKLRNLSIGEIKQARALAETSGKSEQLLTLIRSQLRDQRPELEQGVLLEAAVQLLKDDFQAMSQSKQLLLQAFDNDTSKKDAALLLGKLAAAAGDFDEEKTFLVSFLSNADPVADQRQVFAATLRLCNLGTEKAVRDLLRSALNSWVKNGLMEPVVELCSSLIASGTFVETVSGYLLDIIVVGKRDELEHHLQDIFKAVEIADLPAIYDNAVSLFEANGKETFFFEVICQLCDGDDLDLEVKNFLAKKVGVRLFEHGGQERSAFKLLNFCWDNSPIDSELVVPLYLLKTQFASTVELKDYVAQIIPIVNQSPELLRETAVTLQQLETIAGIDSKALIDANNEPPESEADSWLGRQTDLDQLQFVEGSMDSALRRTLASSSTDQAQEQLPPPLPTLDTDLGQFLDIGFEGPASATAALGEGNPGDDAKATASEFPSDLPEINLREETGSSAKAAPESSSLQGIPVTEGPSISSLQQLAADPRWSDVDVASVLKEKAQSVTDASSLAMPVEVAPDPSRPKSETIALELNFPSDEIGVDHVEINLTNPESWEHAKEFREENSREDPKVAEKKPVSQELDPKTGPINLVEIDTRSAAENSLIEGEAPTIVGIKSKRHLAEKREPGKTEQQGKDHGVGRTDDGDEKLPQPEPREVAPTNLTGDIAVGAKGDPVKTDAEPVGTGPISLEQDGSGEGDFVLEIAGPDRGEELEVAVDKELEVRSTSEQNPPSFNREFATVAGEIPSLPTIPPPPGNKAATEIEAATRFELEEKTQLIPDQGQVESTDPEVGARDDSDDSDGAKAKGVTVGASDRSQTGTKPIDDWRQAVLSRNVNVDPRAITHLAFASETEKHIALQAVSILSGDMSELENWHWRVWRQSGEFAYPLVGKDRFPEGALPNVIDGPLFRLLNFLQPMVVKLFHERFSVQFLAQRFGQSASEVMATAVGMEWNEGVLGKSGLGLMSVRLQRRGYQALSFSGLEHEIFYDAVNKYLFFDSEYYAQKPPGQLLHRISYVVWALELRFYFLLMLDTDSQLLPILAEIEHKLKSHGIDKIKSALRGKNMVRRLLDEVNPHQLRSFFLRLGPVSSDEIGKVKRKMEEKIFQLILSETLDLVGLVEAIISKDIIAKKAKPGDLLAANPHIANLLDFCTRLRFG